MRYSLGPYLARMHCHRSVEGPTCELEFWMSCAGKSLSTGDRHVVSHQEGGWNWTHGELTGIVRD